MFYLGFVNDVTNLVVGGKSMWCRECDFGSPLSFFGGGDRG